MATGKVGNGKWEGIRTTLKREEDKKHSIRYKEVDEDGNFTDSGAVGTMYLKKDKLGKNPPKSLSVRITAGEEE